MFLNTLVSSHSDLYDAPHSFRTSLLLSAPRHGPIRSSYVLTSSQIHCILHPRFVSWRTFTLRSGHPLSCQPVILDCHLPILVMMSAQLYHSMPHDLLQLFYTFFKFSLPPPCCLINPVPLLLYLCFCSKSWPFSPQSKSFLCACLL